MAVFVAVIDTGLLAWLFNIVLILCSSPLETFQAESPLGLGRVRALLQIKAIPLRNPAALFLFVIVLLLASTRPITRERDTCMHSHRSASQPSLLSQPCCKLFRARHSHSAMTAGSQTAATSIIIPLCRKRRCTLYSRAPPWCHPAGSTSIAANALFTVTATALDLH